ncbi:MAG: Asparagine synthetase [glutamine-hydrolyzing] 1 [Myxococcota bacterium]|nr:Asparagine synthetase [glutamine-hydrolyzing] 1 [Myxococcota bacterium]
MCGIAGIWSVDGSAAPLEIVRLMAQSMRHRGPDGAGECASGPGAIGMVRLSIIDIASGQQPFSNETGDIHLVCNGEIYNYKSLRSQMEARGHRFRSHSDVEVILHLYEEYGTGAFALLNGMFAVLILDQQQGRIVAARDHYGQKPLYWAKHGERYLFASEVRALKSAGFSAGKPDPEAISNYLFYRYVPGPGTGFKDVEKLAPGEWITISAGGAIERERFFQPWYASTRTRIRHSPEELWSRFRDAVERHLMSERPLGVFLSGGVDSACTVAAMRELGHNHVRTYAIGFDDFPDSEGNDAARIARYFGCEHRTITVAPDQFWSNLSAAAASVEEPMADWVNVFTGILARESVKEVTVVLFGEGADEILAGYDSIVDRYQWDMVRKFWWSVRAPHLTGGAERILRGKFRTGLRRMNLQGVDELREYRFTMTGELNLKAIPGEVLNPDYLSHDPLESVIGEFYRRSAIQDYVGLMLAGMQEHWLPNDILLKADKMTMMHSLEGRCPFLDRDFTAWCAGLSVRDYFGFHSGRIQGKMILKRAAAKRIPLDVFAPKKGFASPVLTWFRGPLRSQFSSTLLDENAFASSIVSNRYRKELLDSAMAGNDGAIWKAWILVNLNIWAGNCL